MHKLTMNAIRAVNRLLPGAALALSLMTMAPAVAVASTTECCES